MSFVIFTHYDRYWVALIYFNKAGNKKNEFIIEIEMLTRIFFLFFLGL